MLSHNPLHLLVSHLERNMFHPSILRSYAFRRTECQLNPVDACADTAHDWSIKASVLAAFLRSIGIDAAHLRNI